MRKIRETCTVSSRSAAFCGPEKRRESRNVVVLEWYGVAEFDKGDGFELDLRRV